MAYIIFNRAIENDFFGYCLLYFSDPLTFRWQRLDLEAWKYQYISHSRQSPHKPHDGRILYTAANYSAFQGFRGQEKKAWPVSNLIILQLKP